MTILWTDDGNTFGDETMHIEYQLGDQRYWMWGEVALVEAESAESNDVWLWRVQVVEADADIEPSTVTEASTNWRDTAKLATSLAITALLMDSPVHSVGV